MAEYPARIRILQDTSANFTSNNPVLLSGEWGFETDTKKIKIGDGATGWQDLLYKFEEVFTAEERDKLAAISFPDANAEHFLNGEGAFVALPANQIQNNVLRWT